MMPSGEYDDDDDDDVFMHVMSFRWLAKKHVFNVNYIYPFFLREAWKNKNRQLIHACNVNMSFQWLRYVC